MRKLCATLMALVVVLVLAVPAAAEGPVDGGPGWSWSSVVERLGGWADGLWRALAGSETGGEETGDGTVAVAPGDPSTTTTGSEPTTETESWPEYDPDGEP